MGGLKHVCLLAVAAFAASPAQARELTIFWAEWDPANYLQELANEYTAEAGVAVTVATAPWPDFQTKAFLEFAAKGDAFDMVVGDSQWLGAGATGGHYVELTDFVREHRVDEIMVPATMAYYAEYPKDSGRYWAVPLQGDAVGWAYRRDWLEDPDERAAFRRRYGYDLAVPRTWAELRDIAEFFHRPGEDPPRYGVAIYTQTAYDGLAMGYSASLYSHSGEFGDYATCKVEGIVDSPQAVQALEAYKELFAFTPPNWANAGFQENNQAIIEGLVAMSMNYFAFFPSLVNPAVNLHASATGFFMNPAGPGGGRFSPLGGQGISVVAYSGQREAALDFLAWLVREETQERWAALGGNTTHARTLESPAFRAATPYNEAFYQSMFVVKDFWAVPYHAELLRQLNSRLGPYLLDDDGSAAEVLHALAGDWAATIATYGCR
jgi:multiple sugar transport system substrate-binding protein